MRWRNWPGASYSKIKCAQTQSIPCKAKQSGLLHLPGCGSEDLAQCPCLFADGKRTLLRLFNYRATALEQACLLGGEGLRIARIVIDESVWPDWIDRAHLKFGLPVDLRTGMLSQDIGIGFDWLYTSLSDEERKRIVEGLNRRGIQPFLTSMAQDPWWANELSNWCTVIIGGLGIAGMALVGEHPKAEYLVELSLEKMTDYLSIYGSEGEFNESVAYSNATRIPVNYFMAHHYHCGRGPELDRSETVSRDRRMDNLFGSPARPLCRVSEMVGSGQNPW